MDKPERLTSAVKITLDEGIVRVIGLGKPHTADTVREMCAAVLDLTGGRRLPILFDTRNWGEIAPTSWAEFIQRIEDICPAAAVLGILGDFDAGYVGSYPMIIDSLVIPFRIFQEESAALEFLGQFLTAGSQAETPAASLVYENGHVRITGKGSHHSPATVTDTLTAARRLAGGRRIPLLFVNPPWEFDAPSWAQFIGMIADTANAAAVVADDAAVVERLGAYPEVMSGLLVPFEVFADERDALQFVEDHTAG